jgi:hypothetical protein
MKPVCVPCQRFFRPKTNGYYFIEAMPIHDDATPGTAAPEQWAPYKVWVGDLWQCEGCGAEIVVGVGQHRLAEHYEADFNDVVTRTNASQLKVNDC